MTNELLGGAPTGDSSGSTSFVPPVTEPQEKMIPQSQVDKTIGAIKHETYQKARADALEEYKRQQPQQQYAQQQPVTQHGGQNLGGMSQPQGMTPEHVRQIVMEQSQQMQYQGAWNQASGAFSQKMNAYKAKLPDIEEKLQAIGIRNMPELVILANSVENTGEVIEHLLNNPMEIAQLVQAARTPGFDQAAIAGIQKLSASIKLNQTAKNAPRANPPLDQMTPSNIGTSDGPMSAQELCSLDYLQA